jgi:photosynthetic reaction center cytochrome c subunit
MTRELGKRIVVCAAVAIAGFAFWTTSHAQAAQDQSPEKTAAEQFKNIQVLKSMPASKLRGAMEYMSASLGVECGYCHANPWDSDQKETKKTARKMLLMTEAINKDNFGGDMEVSCNTCHRGQIHPGASVSLDGPPAHAEPTAAAAAEMPTAEQLFDKYVQAIGGKAAIDKVTSRVVKGEQVSTDGEKATIETSVKAPGKLVGTTTSTVPAKSVFTVSVGGPTPWRKFEREGGPTQVAQLRDMQLAEVVRDAEIVRGAGLGAGAYQKVSVSGKETVNGHEAYVVRATAPDGNRERFYFDAQTGLLLRREVSFATYLGGLPFRVDYEDYRAVDGVKEPFTVQWTSADGGWTETYTEVKHNVAIEDARFEMPQPPPPAPAPK